MQIMEVLKRAVQTGASDLFLVSGCPLSAKVNGEIAYFSQEKLDSGVAQGLISEIYEIAHRDQLGRLMQTGDDDFSFSVNGLGRFRCNAYKQRGSLAAVLRVVSFELPDPAQMHIPDQVIDLYQKKKGLVLITGPAGSGKSTTLACMIDKINKTCNYHVITIEDPIEYIHSHKKSIVSQREVSNDTADYANALRAALRQSPNVILLGEMRDFETIQTALTAAETGQLVLSTLHTVGAANTIDRIIDVFPANQQQQIRVQLSMVLQAVVSQHLIPTLDGGLIPAFEVMTANSAIRNMIRESKIHQLDNAIYAGAAQGMVTMDASILRLYQQGRISRENALMYASNPEVLAKRMTP